MSVDQPRRSSRANKGQHSARDLLEVYYHAEDEPPLKKLRVDEDEEFQSANVFENASDVELDSDKDLEKEEFGDAKEETDDGEVRCDPCGTTSANYNEDTDEGGIMIECEGCRTWQHARCMGFRTQRAIPKNYMCNKCKPTYGADTSTTSKSPSTKPATGAKLHNKTRASVAKALANVISKNTTDEKVAMLLEDAERVSALLEDAIYTWSGKTTSRKYIDKSRSVMALVKKAAVLLRLMDASLSFLDVVSKPPEEIDLDLKKYADKVRQESIRRSVLTVDDELSQRIRRTHKGEEVVETASNSMEDEVSIVGRNIDYRNFKENTPPREIIALALRNYHFQDDEEEKDEKDNDREKEENEKDAAGDESLSDDELDLILRPKNRVKEPVKPPPQVKLPPTMPTSFWTGEVTFPDFAWVKAKGEFVGCTHYEAPRDITTASFHNKAMKVCKELLVKSRYLVEGRLDRGKADSYLDKITSSRDLYLVHLAGSGTGYDKLHDYLVSRSKVGVLSDRAACVKDAYVFALDPASVPLYLNFAHLKGTGLYALFVVKKDYAVVGKSILKKSAPVVSQVPGDLDSILSKLSSLAHLHQPVQPQVPHLPQIPHLPALPQQAQLPPGLTAEQLRYLSDLVSQNPHVQRNPQALLTLLQQNGFH